MSSHKQQRTFLFRIICMVMLVLIQFDAYGYEMVGHFRENVQPMYSLSAPESLAEGNQENASWSDPVLSDSFFHIPFVCEVMLKFSLLFDSSMSMYENDSLA